MSLNNWFEKGLTTNEFKDTFDHLKDGFINIYENFTLPGDNDFFQMLKDEDIRVLVLAEPWCGHCMLNTPILYRIAEKGDIPVRVLLRDSNLELMDQYLTDQKRIIPIFIFINKEGNEIAKWGPFASYTKQFVDDLKAKLPSEDAKDFEEKRHEMFRKSGKEFQENDAFWNAIYQSIKKTLEDAIR